MDALPDPAAPRLPGREPRGGKLAANIMHFARTLRAAGLPVGPGQVLRRDRGGGGGRHRQPRRFLLDAPCGVREPPRPARDLRPGLPRLLAQPAPAREDDGDAAAADRRAGRAGRGQAAQPRACRRRCSPARARRRRSSPRSRRKSRSRRPSPSPTARCCRRGTSSRCRRRRSTRRCAPSPACACRCRSGATRRFRRRAAAPRVDLRATLRRALRPEGLTELAPARAAPPAAAAGRPVRHLRLDDPLHAHVPAFHARHHQRPRPRLLLPVRHAADQRDARPAQPRRRHRAGRRSRRRSRTGRAARASAQACTSSTTSGRAACWGRAPWCC